MKQNTQSMVTSAAVSRRRAGRKAGRRMLGLTLIELLVALAIGSFLMIGALTVFMQSRTTFRINEAVSRLQENGRFLLDEVEPDIRMASYFGLTTRSSKLQGRATATDPIAFVPAGNDCGPNWSVDVANEVEVSDGAWAWTCAPFGAWMPQSDTLVVRRVSEDPIPVGMLDPNTLHVQSARFQDSQIFLGNAIPAGYLPATSQTHQLLVNGYYISRNSSLDTPGNPVPSLRRMSLIQLDVVDQEVLPGVEDMQIQLGVDTDVEGAPNRGVIDRFVDADDPILDPLAAAFLPDAEVLAVRVWFRLRAERGENGHTDAVAYNYAGQNFGPFNDNFRRIVISKTIYLRNARPPS